jgi:hypothetical protein
MENHSTITEIFEPLHDAHSIEQVVFVVQFDRMIDDATFQSISDFSKKYDTIFPSRTLIQQVSFAFGQGIPIPNAPNSSNGFVFKIFAADGSIQTEFKIERTGITYRTTNYTRWNLIWSQVKEYFDELIPMFIEQARIVNLSLNYVDKFLWSGDIKNFNPSLLLNAESQYLCRHIFNTPDFWHSHTGAFIRSDEETKRLMNVNVDYVDEINNRGEVRKVISILSVITDNLDQPGYTSSNYTKDTVSDFINMHLQSMHEYGKVILSDLIIEKIAQRIALKK